MLKLIGSLLAGPLTSISKDITNAYIARENAKNDAERIAADERINLLESRKSIILAAQSSPIEQWVRVLLALPWVIYEWKLVVYDKVLSLGVTDPLSPALQELFWIVVAGYFIDATVRGTARILKR